MGKVAATLYRVCDGDPWIYSVGYQGISTVDGKGKSQKSAAYNSL